MFPVSFLNSILEFNKLTLLKIKAQEILKNNEITKPVATMDLALGWGTCSLPFANALDNLFKVFSKSLN